MNEIVLAGCTPTPLANYLKALGVLRLLAARHPEMRGCWRGDRFVLHTSLRREDIEQFFLNDYAPTPLVAPWGARSGFYAGSPEKTAREALARVESSKKEQLTAFRSMICSVRSLLHQNGITEKPSEEKKTELLRICRAELPDELLEWLDVCFVISGEDRRFPPLLGTGGNEGSGSYASGFAQQVVACIVDRRHDSALAPALFGIVAPEVSTDQAPGHFSPVDGGWLNASTGFDDKRATTNPWDYIFALEGALAFAGAAVRRCANDPSFTSSFPFTVESVSAGAGSLAEGDVRNKPRGELWLPLWKRPSTYIEVRALTTEGRVALGRRPARDALDFVRAVHNLGGYRGIRSFQRYGFLNRKGDAYFATPLSRIEVGDEPAPSLLDELDKYGWLERFRQFARGDNIANRFLTLRRQLEDRLFELSGRMPARAEVQSLLILLGDIQQALAVSRKAQEGVPPIPVLSERWIAAAEDGSPEFRIAKALAGLRGVGDIALPLRAQLFPVERKRNRWMTPEADEKWRVFTPGKGRLAETLVALLTRRLWLAERLDMRDKPLAGNAGVALDDMAAFLRDDRMDARIAALLPGLSMCEIPRDGEQGAGEGGLPAGFALMKLALTPDRALRGPGHLGETEHLPLPAGMLAQLMAGNHGNRAVRIAWQRLHSSNLGPFLHHRDLPGLGGVHHLRAAAGLLIPLRFGATAALARTLLEAPGSTTETRPAA